MSVRPSLKGPRTHAIRLFLFATIALIVIIVAIRSLVCWSNARYLSPTDGVWLALATDLKNGVFYRPLLGPDGYGGTRYFPLFFVLYALLLKIGLPILMSGYFLSVASITLLIVGIFYLIRNLGAELWLAACSAGIVLAAGSVQLSLLSIHDDGLASALNVCGLAVITSSRRNHPRILMAALLFTLAWSTKVTTVSGFAAAFLWLIFAGSSRTAWELAAETACGYLATFGMMIFASQGRIVGILRACASAGTTLLRTAIGPFHMLSITIRDDPSLLVFLFLALCVLSTKSLRSLPVLFFVATMLVTAVIFGSPGTSRNHLLDLQLAAVILVGTWLADGGDPALKDAGLYALGLATLLAAVPALHALDAEDRALPGDRFEKVIVFIGNTQEPILAENPALPVLAGQRPYAIDPFMVRVLRERDASLREPLLDELRNRTFAAVVLSSRDPSTDAGKTWYEKDIFGPRFLPVLSENYRLAGTIEGQFVYLPNDQRPRERP